MSETNNAPWFWWYVKHGEWHDRRHELDFLDGQLEEMAREAGGGLTHIVFEKDTPTIDITVYFLTAHRLTSEEQDLVGEWENHERTHTGIEIDEWENARPKGPPWFYWFKSIHPSSYLVYIHWGVNNVVSEIHGIFCATYKDMVEVVKLHQGL